jgi:hypothetical protein
LFQLIAFTEDEKTLHLTTGNSVEDCVVATEHWATNREQIWDALDVLETREELAVCYPTFGVTFMFMREQELFSELDVPSRQADRSEARRQDDKTFFEEIVGDIKDALKGYKRYTLEINITSASNSVSPFLGFRVLSAM